MTKHKIQNKSKISLSACSHAQAGNNYEALNARYEKGICLEFQIILSLEFVSDFVLRISDFTSKVLNIDVDTAGLVCCPILRVYILTEDFFEVRQ